MIATELLIGFFLLFTITKLLGKTQFAQITPFDFISALILGELLGNAIYDHEVKIGEIFFTTILWGSLIFVVEKITQKYRRTRKILEGDPNIVINKGHIQYEALKKGKLDLNQMMSLIRQQGYFSISEVEYAILETNGMVSVLPKAKYDTPKMSDLKLPLKDPQLPIALVLDGEVVEENLVELNKDLKWLEKQLSKQSFHRVVDVLYAEWKDQNQPLYVLGYKKKSS
ncbi:DUF421 domain-containing protein [Bacillus mesophilus]|uniref:DUF421 domain-containing protein n=2 Tax=Bacillus mesophilus TaxID=1808955 RepID=A0A6M0Q737_9BACI|nr:DUF421 domain-containing protein [Bacillus mesophilus]